MQSHLLLILVLSNSKTNINKGHSKVQVVQAVQVLLVVLAVQEEVVQEVQVQHVC